MGIHLGFAGRKPLGLDDVLDDWVTEWLCLVVRLVLGYKTLISCNTKKV